MKISCPGFGALLFLGNTKSNPEVLNMKLLKEDFSPTPPKLAKEMLDVHGIMIDKVLGGDRTTNYANIQRYWNNLFSVH